MPFAGDVIAPNFVPLPGSSVVVAYLENEAVLYDTGSQRSVLLNVTAARIWSLCDGTSSVSAIGSSVAETFSKPAEDVAQDVADVITNFGDLGLLQGIDPLTIS